MAAPATSTDIAKLTLSHLKGGAITSISPPDTGSKEARVMAQWYDTARRFALEQHPWHFARKRREVAAENDAPAFEYLKKYELPPDYVRLVRIGETWYDPEGDYEIESGYILCNETTPAQLVYIFDQTDVTKFSPSFILYLSHILANFACYDITGAKDLIMPLEELNSLYLGKAEQINAQNRPPRKVQHSRLKNARMRIGRYPDSRNWGDD